MFDVKGSMHSLLPRRLEVDAVGITAVKSEFRRPYLAMFFFRHKKMITSNLSLKMLNFIDEIQTKLLKLILESV